MLSSLVRQKVHFENVVNLAESKDLELTESKLVDDVKKVLIEQYKSELPIKMNPLQNLIYL